MIGAVKADALALFREAHGKTDEALNHLAGLSRALYSMAAETPALMSNDPDANAILSLIVVIEEKAEQAAERHGVEWGLIVKPQNA